MADRYFLTFAKYNAWANLRLYDACAELSEAEYMKERPAFFRSIHGTLNHILVGDRVWIARIERKPPLKVTLDQILYGDLVALRVARVAEDEHIIHLVSEISPRALDQPLAYANLAGERQKTVMRYVLAHFFNHQTHHRGQAHALITAAGEKTEDTDLFLVVPEIIA